ncbi:hypothetical protein [Streptomyces sp. NPDC094472]|uniref:hypothetical protein n=1 Tax=Streptomyces sp. NPDC094472 TaxID=3155080 RepID=UPI003329D4E0
MNSGSETVGENAAGPKKAFVVIGAGPGLGAAAARRFGHKGHPVGLIARDAGRLERDGGRPGLQAPGNVCSPGHRDRGRDRR